MDLIQVLFESNLYKICHGPNTSFFLHKENLVEEMMKNETFLLVANRYHNLLLNNNNILNLILI